MPRMYNSYTHNSCLKGYGEPLEKEIRGDNKGRLDEVWDSLQAIGFSKEVCVYTFMCTHVCTSIEYMYVLIPFLL